MNLVYKLYVNVKIIMKGSEMYMDGNCKVFLLRFNRGLQVIHESRIIISNWLQYTFFLCVGISKILIESIEEILI